MVKRRVLVYDPYLDEEWAESLTRTITAGHRSDLEVIIPWVPAVADDELTSADVVIVTGRRTLGKEQLRTMRRTLGIVCFSVGMDQVDAVAAAEAAIPVTNVPDYCTDEVADHAMTLLLAAMRRLIPLAAETRSGRWTDHETVDTTTIRRLRGQTVGLLGAGRIGQAVAHRAQAFGFRTIATDPGVSALPDSSIDLVPLEELARTSDAVVICAALVPESRRVIGTKFLAQARPGMIVVNVSRGGLIDESALAAALDRGTVAIAALDVRDVEPPVPNSDQLADRPDVILTPHIAGTSVEAFEDLLGKTAAKVHSFIDAADNAAPRSGVRT